MIDILTGYVVRLDDNKYTIHLNDKVSLSFRTTSNFSENKGNLQDKKVYIHLTFSEQKGFVLYGFNSEEQRQFFLDLISVQGIGYNLALKIMSQIDYEDFKVYVFIKDKKELCKIKDVGNKKAENIINKLKITYQ